MKKEFSIILLNHAKFGWSAGAYLTVPDISGGYRHVTERITPGGESYSALLTLEKQLVTLCDSISDEKILERFGKKKVGYAEFYKKIDPGLLNHHILPFISRKIHQILQICLQEKLPLYKSDYRPKKVFQHDILSYSSSSARTIFNFIRNKEELYYYLSVKVGEEEFKLFRSSAVLLLQFPCYLLIGNRVLYFEEIDGKKLQPFFEKQHIVIPPTAVRKYLESFVYNALVHYDVRTIGFQVKELNLAPTPVLTGEVGVFHEYIFRLQFEYAEGVAFASAGKEQSKVILYWNEGEYFFTRYHRNTTKEKKYMKALEDEGLNLYKEGYYILPEGQSLDRVLRWLSSNPERLNQHGIRLEQHFGSKKYQLEECSIELDWEANSHKLDWFDIKGQVKFGSFSFSILALRPYIARGIREFPLPDGTVGLIPEEWFSNLEPVFAHSLDSGNGLTIRKHYFNLVRQASSQKSGLILAKSDQLETLSEIPSCELPKAVRASLRPYQAEGYNWMMYLHHHQFGGCLADDMGLGKTLQTLTMLQKLYQSDGPVTQVQSPIIQAYPGKQLSLFEEPPLIISKPERKPKASKADQPEYSSADQHNPSLPASLIVVPTSLIHNWHNEIKKFTPSLRVMLFVGAKRTKSKLTYRQFDAHALVITSYGTLRNDIEVLKNYAWNYVILDESQTIKNPESKIFQAVMELQPAYRLVLTGTPIENSLKDLWAQMNFLNPGLLGNLEFFKKQYIQPVEAGANLKQAEKLKTLTRPFILRRTKEEVASDLPDLTQLVHYCEMVPEQKELYQTYKNQLRNSLLQAIETQGMSKSGMLILRGIQQLRQLANHPVMIESDYIQGSGKLDQVIETLENLREEKHKVLIFSNFVKHLDILKQNFVEREWSYSYLTGASTARENIIEEFQKDEKRLFFLISMKAGGVGLNLTQADYILILDPWWNPAVEMQAVSRAHRIGQQKKVFVYRFISEESIEEKIQVLQERKRGLADQFINSNNPIMGFKLEDIRELFE